jgi:hypothetical protein
VALSLKCYELTTFPRLIWRIELSRICLLPLSKLRESEQSFISASASPPFQPPNAPSEYQRFHVHFHVEVELKIDKRNTIFLDLAIRTTLFNVNFNAIS